MLKASGRGMLFAESYGAIHELDVPAGQEMIVDNGHLVAWPGIDRLHDRESQLGLDFQFPHFRRGHRVPLQGTG